MAVIFKGAFLHRNSHYRIYTSSPTPPATPDSEGAAWVAYTNDSSLARPYPAVSNAGTFTSDAAPTTDGATWSSYSSTSSKPNTYPAVSGNATSNN